jgi:hypothetical protein
MLISENTLNGARRRTRRTKYPMSKKCTLTRLLFYRVLPTQGMDLSQKKGNLWIHKLVSESRHRKNIRPN